MKSAIVTLLMCSIVMSCYAQTDLVEKMLVKLNKFTGHVGNLALLWWPFVAA